MAPLTAGDFAWPEPAPHPPEGYLDAVAGQPCLPVAQQALAAGMAQSWSDPARLHHSGRRAGLVLDTARAALANFLNVSAGECFLGPSAADLLRAAVGGLFEARVAAGAPPRVLVGAVESMAVRFAAQALPGAALIDIPVDECGRIDPGALADELDAGAALACVQLANAEIGTTQPAEQMHQLCAGAGVPLLSDATQVAGHAEVGTAWDALVASPRDWGGPSGAAVLVVRPGVRWRPQEAPDRGWVGGFPDVPAAAAGAAAAEYVGPHWREQARVHRTQTARIREALTALPGVRPVGDPTERLPHIVTFVVDDAVGEQLVTELDRRGIAAASGSACTADNRMPSHVLEAIGIATAASIRVSLPYGCTDQTVEQFLEALPQAVTEARGERG